MASMMIRPTAPISSAITPMLLTVEMIRTPSRFTVVVRTIMIAPRMNAFLANAGSWKTREFLSVQVEPAAVGSPR